MQWDEVYDGRDDDEDDGDAPPNDGWMMRWDYSGARTAAAIILRQGFFFQTLSKPIISFHLEFLFLIDALNLNWKLISGDV